MNLVNDIKAIIRAGVSAPSGDNLQPWRFVVVDNVIEVHALTLGDEIKFGGYYALFITQGALIENLVIAADHYGYDSVVSLFPDKNNRLHVASINLRFDPIDRGVDLFRFFDKRLTDRHGYSPERLSSDIKKALQEAGEEMVEGSRLVFVEDKQDIYTIAKCVVGQIEVLFSHKTLHELFFKSLRWSGADAHGTADGLDVRTLHLNIFKKFFFHYMLRSWVFVKILSKLYIHKVAALMESVRYKEAGAYCALIKSGEQINDEEAVAAGRAMERFWLMATRLGLRVQPTFAVFLIKHSFDFDLFDYSEAQKELIDMKSKTMESICGVGEGETLLWLTRIGYPKYKEQYQTYRKNPEVVFK